MLYPSCFFEPGKTKSEFTTSMLVEWEWFDIPVEIARFLPDICRDGELRFNDWNGHTCILKGQSYKYEVRLDENGQASVKLPVFKKVKVSAEITGDV